MPQILSPTWNPRTAKCGKDGVTRDDNHSANFPDLTMHNLRARYQNQPHNLRNALGPPRNFLSRGWKPAVAPTRADRFMHDLRPHRRDGIQSPPRRATGCKKFPHRQSRHPQRQTFPRILFNNSIRLRFCVYRIDFIFLVRVPKYLACRTRRSRTDISRRLSIVKTLHAFLSLLSRRRPRAGANLRLACDPRPTRARAAADVRRRFILDRRLRHYLCLPGLSKRSTNRRLLDSRKGRHRQRPLDRAN